MNSQKKGIRQTVVVLLAVAGLFVGLYTSHVLFSKKELNFSQFHGTYLEIPREISAFSLKGTDNKPFDNARLKGHWTYMFFGFTQCGYLCPTTMAELNKMYHLLEEKGIKQMPQVVMVSLDPDRDTLDKLKQYVIAFNPHFYGARGDEQQTQQLSRELGIAFEKVKLKAGDDPKNYDVQHTGAVMLFNPEGNLNAFFTSPHHADLLADDYTMLAH